MSHVRYPSRLHICDDAKTLRPALGIKLESELGGDHNFPSERGKSFAMSDSRPIVVTVDANAAIAGPLLYEGPEIAPGQFDLACAQTGGIPVRSGGQAGSLIVPAPRAETEV